MRRLLLFSVLIAMLSMPAVLALPDDGSLLANGDFEAARQGKRPDGWGLVDGATWEKEGANHFLRLKSPRPGATVLVYRAITLAPDTKALELRCRVRHAGIKRGKQSWFDGRIMMNFKDAQGHVLQPGPNPPSFTGAAAEWRQHTQQFRVPEGAVTFEIMPALFQAESGQIDFDDIRLVPFSLAAVEAAEATARAKEAARIAALPEPQPQVAVPSPDKLPKELHVTGNQICSASGETVWLQGVAIPSLEWSAAGENILKSIAVAIQDWKANCIRLPIREHFWAGKGPGQKDGGRQYRQTVADAVNLCAGQGVYLVLDLHDYRAPVEKHALFWKDVAGRYGNHPAVLFDILNEPHDISWDVWRNGGAVTDKKKATDAIAENNEALQSFQSVGMQGLVDVIRGTGAKNIIIAGGLDWGYDLSGVLNGYALDNRGGNGIVYSSHVYPWKDNWQGKFLNAARKHPLFLGEVGADSDKLSFLPLERQEDPYTWVPDMLAVIQKYRLNWTAWSFHPKASPRVLLDWNYTPTPFWGEFVRKALAGERFALKKMR